MSVREAVRDPDCHVGWDTFVSAFVCVPHWGHHQGFPPPEWGLAGET